MNESDLRVQRTRRLLQEALIELVNRQNYDQLTIRDITRHAQVGYKTFFRHYESKEALLQAVINGVLAQFRHQIAAESNPDAVTKNTLVAFRLAKQNADLYRAVLSSPMSGQLLEPVIQMMLQDAAQFSADPSLPNDLVGQYFASSMLGLTQWWLTKGEAFSAEEMVQFVDRLVIRPIQQRPDA